MNLLEPEFRKIEEDKGSEYLRFYIQTCFEDFHSYDITLALEGMSAEMVTEVVEALEEPQGRAVFEYLMESVRTEVFLLFDKESQVNMIEKMAHDERIDLLKTLPKDLMQTICQRIPEEDMRDIRNLIGYDEETTGALMTSDYTFLSVGMIVSEALKKVREEAKNKETIYYLYVVDGGHRLVGFVSLRDLIMAKDSDEIKDIMKADVLRIQDEDDKKEAAQMISDYDLLALPVVNIQGKLVGIVTVDDVVDTLMEENTEEIFNLAAAGSPLDYFKSSILMVFKERVIWLIILVLVGFISSAVLRNFQPMIEASIALIFFLPLMCSAGGNAGTQSATVVIRGLAMNNIHVRDIGRVFIKECLVGILLGVCIGAFSFLRSLMMGTSLLLGLVVALSTTVTLILSTSIGCLLPLLSKRLNVDPALMSGPLIASLVDIFCIFVYFSIARVFLI